MTLFSFTSGVALALTTVREHKLRSFLTILGVIIGTGAVIGVGSIIVGLDGAISGALGQFSPNTLLVYKWKTGLNFNLTPEESKRKPITLQQARAVEERCPSVDHVSPYLMPERGIHKARFKGNDNYRLQIGGTEEGYISSGTLTNGTQMKYGRFFTDSESQHRQPVVAVGEDVATSLFGPFDPTGKVIQVDGHSVEVVGVMNRPAASFPGMEDNRVLFPYFTMRKMFPNAKEHMLVVIAKDGLVARANDELRAVLRLERRVPHDKPDSFAISTSEQMIEDFHRVTSTVALVMVVISSIGLLVGGIGVMNIMLVSVTERTREIGIRKAVGARRGDIVLQFLTEAVVLTFIGGLLGLLLGWLISLAAGLVFPTLPTAVPFWAAASGVAVSVGVGLFFGIWPAGRAAKLDPVEALRYE